VATTYEFVHHNGSLDADHGNSTPGTRDERPLIASTNL
jgi:hypothetical protein